MDELVKDLRESAPRALAEADFDFVEGWLKEAADAIEELSKYAGTIRRLKCEGWYLQQTKFHDGYHAVSTMPLPEPPKAEEVET